MVSCHLAASCVRSTTARCCRPPRACAAPNLCDLAGLALLQPCGPRVGSLAGQACGADSLAVGGRYLIAREADLANGEARACLQHLPPSRP